MDLEISGSLLLSDKIDSTDYLVNSASTQDCTGLIPRGLQSDEEVEAYEEIYHYLPPKVEKKKQE